MSMLVVLLFLIVWVAEILLYFSSRGKYDDCVAQLDKREYPLKAFLPMSLHLLKLSGYKHNTKYDNNLLRKITQVQGAKHARYYLEIHWANKIAFLLVGIIIVLFIGSILMMPQRQAESEDILALDRNGELQRPEFGEGDKRSRVEAVIEKGDIRISEPYTFIVKEMPPATEDEKDLALAKEMLKEDTIKGENKSIESIEKPLTLPVTDESFGNKGVSIKWESQAPKIMAEDGKVCRPPYGSEKRSFYIRAVMTKGSAGPVFKYFRVTVVPSDIPQTDRQAVQAVKEKLAELLKNQSMLSDAKSRTLRLPSQLEALEGVKISWFNEKAKEDSTGILFVLFGFVLLVISSFTLDNSLDKKVSRRRLMLQLDFPDFLNKLTLLVNAGMTLGRAWEKIVTENKRERPLYEELALALSEIRSGKPEAYAFEDFAMRCGIPEITKFVSVILQNMKKGNSELVPVLKLQARDCWEMRKNAAKKLGEEASAKMLLPMMIMFAAIVIIVALPAVLAMQGM